MSIELDTIVERAIRSSTNRHELWADLIAALGCKSCCEIGVWKGEFAQTMLEQVPGIECYTLIDPWRNLPNWNKPANRSDIEFEAIRAEALGRVDGFRDKVVEIRDTTKNAVRSIDDASLDFVYVDGDHTLRGITLDLLSILSKVRPGGFIAGDDFSKTIWQHGTRYTPTEVFPFAIHFAEAHDFKIYTLPFDQFLIVAKTDAFSVKDYGGYAALTPTQIYAPPKRSIVGLLRRLVRRVIR